MSADTHVDGSEPKPRNYWLWLATGLLLCICIGVRVRALRAPLGLTRDEAAVAMNVLGRSEWELLTKPLDGGQSAPLGYLLVTKWSRRLLGNGEVALRLPATVASILTLLIYPFFSRRFLSPWGQLVSLALIGFSGSLAVYAMSVKQYASDALITTVLLALGGWVIHSPAAKMRFLTLALAGVVAVFFSQPAVFVLGGIGGALILDAIARKRWRVALGWVTVSAVWFACFLPIYLLVYRHYARNSGLLDWWGDKFAPLPPKSLKDLSWYNDTFFQMFADTLGLKANHLAGLCCLFGAFILARRYDRRLLGFLTLPILIALAASGIHAYPFSDRLLTFTVPLLATLVAVGLASVGDRADSNLRLFRGLATAVLLLYPTYITFQSLKSGKLPFYNNHDVKPAMAYIADHQREGDVIYVNYASETLWDYYANQINYRDFKGKPIVQGIFAKDSTGLGGTLEAYDKDLDRVRGNARVWFVFSMSHEQEEPFYRYLLAKYGEPLEVDRGPRSSVLLYDLSAVKPPVETTGRSSASNTP